MSVFIIAEAGVNHNGDINLAKKLIDAAKEANVDAIKFQTFKTEKIVGKFADMAEYQKENVEKKESQYEMIKKLELSYEAFKELKQYCNKNNIMFLSTPDDEDSLDFLVDLKVPMIKIGSTEITNLDYLRKIAKKNLPIVLSTGMSTLGEVETALNTIYEEGNRNVTLLHATTDYPTRYEDVNLKAMSTLNMEGPDHKASLEPQELKEFVKKIRNTELLLGDGIKRPTKREEAIITAVRRSIVASYDLKKGSVITEEMLQFKRPGNGIKPEMANILIGRELKRDIKEDEVIKWEDI